ncbi:MAG: nucleotidyltransferase family protein [Candidatus Nitrosocaldaceae archaeon]
MQAIILAGGFGKRLKPLTDEIPKPMIMINNKPIIHRQIEWLKSNGIDEIIIAAGYKHEHIINYLTNHDLKVSYAIEDKPLDTGGGIKNAMSMIDDNYFIAINGDILTDIRLDALFNSIDDSIASIALVTLPSPFGIVEVDSNCNVNGFVEKPKIKDYWINAGVYYLSNKIRDYLPDVGSIERDTFPLLVKKHMLKAVKYNDVYWRSIDSHKDIEEASKELR